jgi:hypothetical protein
MSSFGAAEEVAPFSFYPACGGVDSGYCLLIADILQQ